MNDRTPVITGIGVVAPGGIGTKPFWELLVDGRTATRRISLFDPSAFRSQVGAEVDFDPQLAGLTAAQAGSMDRLNQFAVVSAREAVADSGIDIAAVDPYRVGTVIGSAVGATTSLEDVYTQVSGNGSRWWVDEAPGSVDLYSYLVPSSVVRDVAWTIGAQGPSALISTGCTAGIDAVAHGIGFIQDGRADVMLVGASEAPISPISAASFDAIRATTTSNDDPEHASRPFDARRNGFVLGEGAAMFVVESAAHARSRGAHVYASIIGSASRSNAYHMTGLTPDGLEMAHAINAALDQARLAPDAVDYINAHGSGTRQNDRHETAAFKRSLGEHAYRVPVSSIKSMIGHSLGAVGSLEIAACALALEHQVVPPTANFAEPDPACDLDYVPNIARDQRTDVVLTVGSGFGGFQSAMVLTRPQGAPI